MVLAYSNYSKLVYDVTTDHWGGVMVMWKMLVGLGRCDSCQEKCQSSVRCERY